MRIDADVLGPQKHVHPIPRRERARRAQGEAAAADVRDIDALAGHGHDPRGQDVDLADETGDVQVGRLLVDFLRRADLFDAALIHDHHAIGHCKSLFLIVGHEHEGDAEASLEAFDLKLHGAPQLVVEGAERLVEEQHQRLVDHGAGDGHALLLAAGKLMRATVRVLFEMHHAQGFQHPALDLAFRTGLHPKPESHVVAHGHMREQRVILKHGIDLTALRRDVVHPLPADGYVSLIRGLEARKDSQDGRLAATGRPKEGQKLAVADTQINALKRASVLERFVHTPQFDDIVLSGHSSRLPPYPCMEGRASPNGIATYRPFTAPLVLQCRFLRKSLQRLVRAARQDSRRLSQDLLFHASST